MFELIWLMVKLIISFSIALCIVFVLLGIIGLIIQTITDFIVDKFDNIK